MATVAITVRVDETVKESEYLSDRLINKKLDEAEREAADPNIKWLSHNEVFGSIIKRGRFDYTEWRENLYEDMTLKELVSRAAEFERQHPELVPANAEII
jgi:hypothetical protein